VRAVWRIRPSRCRGSDAWRSLCSTAARRAQASLICGMEMLPLNGRSPSEMTRTIGADSLEFLSLEGLLDTAVPINGFCTGCFSGMYPIDVDGLRQASVRDYMHDTR